MSAPRFLAVAGTGDDTLEVLAANAQTQGLIVRLRRPGLLVAAAPELPALALGEEGVVLGRLFAAGRCTPYEQLAPDATAAILASGGDRLIHGYWGNYVAILAREGVTVIRAPFGTLPCLAQQDGAIVRLGSSPAMLRVAGAPAPRLDARAIARHLLAQDLRRAETCLTGISELNGGDRLTRTGTAMERDTLWSPWRFVDPAQRIDDPADAVRRLGDQARACVRSHIAGARAPLLLLSGGLDSSLVATCLTAAQADFACLNLTTRNSTGDERDFARLVADRFGRPLAIEPSRIEDVDLAVSASVALPRPVARGFEQGSYRSVAAVAKQLGSDLLVDGGGGDNVFCSLQSPSPVSDCLIDEAGRDALWPTVATLSALTQASTLRILWRAWRRARQRRGSRWAADARFLSRDTAALVPSALAHPWLAPPTTVLPGRASHVAMLIPARGLVENGGFGYPLPACSPLVSQPLVETCLRIPSWRWFARGSNRAAAREAIAGILPDEIVWRRDKGTPDSFLVELYEANRRLLHDALLGGVLAREGLLDTAAIAAVLADPAPARDHGFVRILQLMDAEAWARAWA